MQFSKHRAYETTVERLKLPCNVRLILFFDSTRLFVVLLFTNDFRYEGDLLPYDSLDHRNPGVVRTRERAYETEIDHFQVLSTQRGTGERI